MEQENNGHWDSDSDPLNISNFSEDENVEYLFIEIDDEYYEKLSNEDSSGRTAYSSSDPLNIPEQSSFANQNHDRDPTLGKAQWTVSGVNKRIDCVGEIQKSQLEETKILMEKMSSVQNHFSERISSLQNVFTERMTTVENIFTESLSSVQNTMQAQLSALEELKEQHETLQDKVSEVSAEMVQVESRLDNRVDELASNLDSYGIALNEVLCIQQQNQQQYEKNRKENTARFSQLEQSVAVFVQSNSSAAVGVGIGVGVQPNKRKNRRGAPSMPVLTPQRYRQPRGECPCCLQELSKSSINKHLKKCRKLN